MKSNYYKPLLLAMSYFIATATGLCGENTGAGEYKPLLEQGKTWRYSTVDWTTIQYPTFNPGSPTERVKEARLEGYETINGETYMKLNTYCYDEDLAEYYNDPKYPEYNNTMYYLREDTEAGKVYFYPNEDFWDYISWEHWINQLWIYEEWCLNEPGLLYDFKSTDGHNFSVYDTKEISPVTLTDGDHRCFIIDENYRRDIYRIIEGIGLTGMGKHAAYSEGCSILGISMSGRPAFPDPYYDSYLYEVVNADGEVIYSDDGYRPGWWRAAVGITDAVAQAKVNVSADGIIITGAPDMEACLCDMQGRVLEQRPTQGGSLTLSTAGLAHGVYLLRLGSKTYKIAVK